MQAQELQTILQYEKLLSDLYADLAIFPANNAWLQQLVKLFKLDSAVVVIDNSSSYEMTYVDGVGRAKHNLETPPGKWAHSLWGLDPGRDIPLRQAYVFNENSLQSTRRLRRFLKYCLEPFQLSSLLCLNIDSSSDDRICIRLGRSADRSCFNQNELQLLEGLAAHIQRAFRLAHPPYANAARHSSQALLESLKLSTAVIDESWRILSINSGGVAALNAIPYTSIEDNRLRISNSAMKKQFAELLARARDDEKFHVVTLGLEDGAVLQIVLKPCVRPPAVQLYFKTDPALAAQAVDIRLLMELFDFSPSEARVAAALASGATIDGVAAQLHRSRNTVRAHARTIYQKANVESQAQLTALILSSPAGYLS